MFINEIEERRAGRIEAILDDLTEAVNAFLDTGDGDAPGEIAARAADIRDMARDIERARARMVG